MLRLGATYLSMKRFEPARLILQKALDAAPDDVEPRLALGYCLLHDNQPESALVQYRRALDIAPANHKTHNGVGVTLMTMYLANRQNRDLGVQALESWHRSLELQSDQPQIKNLIAKYTRELYGQTADLQNLAP